jgi:hypothetical protein
LTLEFLLVVMGCGGITAFQPMRSVALGTVELGVEEGAGSG